MTGFLRAGDALGLLRYAFEVFLEKAMCIAPAGGQ
jgi:hypothetical protein